MKLFRTIAILVLCCIPFRQAYAGIASHATGKTNATISLPLLTGTLFGYDIAGLIIPKAIKLKENRLPDVHPQAAYFSKMSPWARPIVVQQKTVNWTNPQYVSNKYCVKIKLKVPYMGEIGPLYVLTENTTEISEDWEDSRITGQHEEILASWNGLWFKAPSTGGPLWGNEPDEDDAAADVLGVGTWDPNGSYDYNYNTLVVATIYTADCGLQGPGEELPPTELDVTRFAQLPGGCSGDNCAQFETEYTGPTITEIVEKIVDGILTLVERIKVVPVPISFAVTAKHRDGLFANQRPKTGKCSSSATKDAQTGELCDRDGQWTSGFIPRSEYKDVAYHATEEHEVYLSGTASEKPAVMPMVNLTYHSAEEKTKDASCFGTPLVATLNREKDGDLVYGDNESYTKYMDNCLPEEPMQCKIDTWEEIISKLDKAISDAANEYGQYIPGGSATLNRILHVIFDIEVRNDNTINPELGGTYVCEENSATAAGPFQIKTETYGLVTNQCSSEYIADDLSGCKTEDTQLSRCITEDAAKLAARAILFSGGYWVYTPNQCTNREATIPDYNALYEAVCNYGEGMCNPLDHLEGQTYCEYVFNQAGLPIPPNSCP